MELKLTLFQVEAIEREKKRRDEQEQIKLQKEAVRCGGSVILNSTKTFVKENFISFMLCLKLKRLKIILTIIIN